MNTRFGMSSSRPPAVLLVLFGLFPLVFIGIGGWQAWEQQRKLTTYRPVPARVVSSRVVSHRGSKSTTYKPVIEYRYEVEGRSYTSARVTAINYSAGRDWARRIVADHPPGLSTNAYCSPADPNDAFLLRQATFVPYVFILFPSLFWAIALSFGLGAHAAKPPAMLPLTPDGWAELQPTSLVANRLRAATVVSALWFAVGLVACGHYFWSAPEPYETTALVAAPIFFAFGLVPLISAFYYRRLRANIGDARLWINADRLARGAEFRARVEQPIHQNLHVEEMQIGLVCDETRQERHGGKTRTSTHSIYTDRMPVVPENFARAGNTLTAVTTLRVPVDRPATSPTGSGYPRYDWRLEVATRIADNPDYRAKFPVMIAR